MSKAKINMYGVGKCPKCGEMEYNYGYDAIESVKDDQNQWIAVEYARCLNPACRHKWQNIYTYAGYRENDQ